MRRFGRLLVAATIVLMPAGVRAADLVVWWDKRVHHEEDEAVRETTGASEERARSGSSCTNSR